MCSVKNQILGVDDRNNWNELQSNFCGVAIVGLMPHRTNNGLNVFPQSVIRRLNNGIQPLADRIMTLILQLIQAAGKTSTVLEDAFLVVGSLASGMRTFYLVCHSLAESGFFPQHSNKTSLLTSRHSFPSSTRL
jgi:importin subunit beta-1